VSVAKFISSALEASSFVNSRLLLLKLASIRLGVIPLMCKRPGKFVFPHHPWTLLVSNSIFLCGCLGDGKCAGAS
jgi:hypothetical protein